MNDVAKELRNAVLPCSQSGDRAVYVSWLDHMDKGADEIDRLEADNVRLETKLDKACNALNQARAELVEATDPIPAVGLGVSNTRMANRIIELKTELAAMKKALTEANLGKNRAESRLSEACMARAEAATLERARATTPSPELVAAAEQFARAFVPPCQRLFY